MLCASEDSNMNQTYSMCVCFVHSVKIEPFLSSYDFIPISSRFRIIEMRRKTLRWNLDAYLKSKSLAQLKALYMRKCVNAHTYHTHTEWMLNFIWIIFGWHIYIYSLSKINFSLFSFHLFIVGDRKMVGSIFLCSDTRIYVFVSLSLLLLFFFHVIFSLIQNDA